jgi:alkylated DNA nucleotide flippase Atl1
MDNDRLTAVLDGIPSGCWVSYADVAVAAGGTLQHARALNGRLTRLGHKHAHRVLKSNGAIAPTALGDPDAVRRKLKREGLKFTGGRAPMENRMRPEGALAAAAA